MLAPRIRVRGLGPTDFWSSSEPRDARRVSRRMQRDPLRSPAADSTSASTRDECGAIAVRRASYSRDPSSRTCATPSWRRGTPSSPVGRGLLQPGYAIAPPQIGSALGLGMVGLDDVRGAGGDRDRPGPAADLPVEHRRQREIEQDVPSIIADAVDQLAGSARAALAAARDRRRRRRHMPEQVEREAEQRRRSGQAQAGYRPRPPPRRAACRTPRRRWARCRSAEARVASRAASGWKRRRLRRSSSSRGRPLHPGSRRNSAAEADACQLPRRRCAKNLVSLGYCGTFAGDGKRKSRSAGGGPLCECGRRIAAGRRRRRRGRAVRAASEAGAGPIVFAVPGGGLDAGGEADLDRVVGARHDRGRHRRPRCRSGGGRRAVARRRTRSVRATGKASDGLVSRWLNRPISRSISIVLLRRAGRPADPRHIRHRPDRLWSCSLARSAAASGLVGGALLFHVASVFDGVDGEIARATWRSSRAGAALDTIVDMATNVLFLVGIVTNLAMRDIPTLCRSAFGRLACSCSASRR